MSILGTAFLGWLVSFLGQLPLGNTSITATQIGVDETVKNAWLFSIGVALVEIIYLRVALSGMNSVVAHETFFFGSELVFHCFVSGTWYCHHCGSQQKEGTKKSHLTQ